MSRVIPKFVIGHWSVGNYKPNHTDLEAYDLLIGGEKGEWYKGNHELDNNKAATAGMNSITYNIACCGAMDKTPLTKVQCESFFKACAIKLKLFNLTVKDFFTHAEIGELCKNGEIKHLLTPNGYLKYNIGKIDLTKLPYDFKGKSHGDFIRNKIQWYYDKL